MIDAVSVLFMFFGQARNGKLFSCRDKNAHKKESRKATPLRPNFYALIVFVKGSLAASANVIVGLKSFDIRAHFMKISAESTLRFAIGVADVIAAYLALSAQRANLTHSDTSVKRKN